MVDVWQMTTAAGANNKTMPKEVMIMPRGDGTGPNGAGPRTGRGTGMGQGQGRGRMGGFGLGLGGKCVCAKCGKKVSHPRSCLFRVGAPATSLWLSGYNALARRVV